MPRLCYDLVVIGSGPAGQKAALLAAKLGRQQAAQATEPAATVPLGKAAQGRNDE